MRARANPWFAKAPDFGPVPECLTAGDPVFFAVDMGWADNPQVGAWRPVIRGGWPFVGGSRLPRKLKKRLRSFFYTPAWAGHITASAPGWSAKWHLAAE